MDLPFALFVIAVCVVVVAVACVRVGTRDEEATPPLVTYWFRIGGADVKVAAFSPTDAEGVLRENGYSPMAIRNSYIVGSELQSQ